MSAHLVLTMWFQGTDVAASSDSMKLLVIFVGVIALGSLVQLMVIAGAAFGAWKAYTSTQKALHEMKGKAYPMVASVQGVVDDIRPKVVSITESVRAIVEDAKPKVASLTENVRAMVEDVKPKVASVTENVRSMVEDVKPKVASVTENVRSIVEDATPKVKSVTENVKTISNNFTETTTTLKEKAQAIAGNVTDTVEDANKKTRAQVDRVDGMISSAFTATGEMAAKIQHGIKVPVNEVVGWVNGAKASLDKFLSHEKAVVKDVAAKAEKAARGSADGPLGGLLGLFRKPKQPPAKWHQPSAAETLTKSGFPETGRSGEAEQYQDVAAQAAEHDVLNDPSSAVVASPGAQEVVDRFLAEHKDEMPKPVL